MKVSVERIEKLRQINKGDHLIIYAANGPEHIKVVKVKVSENDGEEVIYNLRKNFYFNVEMYLDGTGRVKDCYRINAEKTK